MNIDLRQLRYFVTVAEELHFGRAAERLHMTQPPLSQAIAAFEEALGAPLFERSRRQVSLSPAGAALLPEARRLLEAASSLPELVRRAASGEAGRLALSFVTPADYSVLPPLLRDYSAAYPDVQLVLQEATTDVQVDDLLHERIDAGLIIPPLSEKAQARLDYLKRQPGVGGHGLGTCATIRVEPDATRRRIPCPRRPVAACGARHMLATR
jgi:DNA-binding transcriptional LysR family regulator